MSLSTERKTEDGLTPIALKRSIPVETARAPMVATPLKSKNNADRVYFSLLQTVTTAFLQGPELLSLSVEAVCDRNRTRIFEYGFVRGRVGYPIVYLIPGFGCPYHHETVLFLANAINEKGFHVAVLHSPSHPEFLLSSHHSGVGGIISEDAKDALIGIEAISEQLKYFGVNYSKKHLVGYSMGALNAAFAHSINGSNRETFESVVLINPPVDLEYGTSQLDGFVNALTMSKSAKARLIAKASVAILAPMRLRKNRQALIERFLHRPIWSETELRSLIGYSFEGTVAGGMRVASLLGTLAEEHNVRTFSDYCNVATVPHYQQANPGATILDFFQNESLSRIGPAIAQSGNVHVLHNEDDFLLRPQDVNWLKTTFGNNATLFESGGHLGNIWRPEFQAALESALGI